MTNMPADAMGGMDADMMTNMPADAMGGMDADMMANMPKECSDAMSPAQMANMPADATGGIDDGGMGALGVALADPIPDGPAPMDATADAALTAMDAGAVAGSSPSAGMDEQADAADFAAIEPDDAPVVEDDPLVDMA
jgi:hypothetical protein